MHCFQGGSLEFSLFLGRNRVEHTKSSTEGAAFSSISTEESMGEL